MIQPRDGGDTAQGSSSRARGMSPWQVLATSLSTLTVVLLAVAWWVWQPATLRIAVGPPGSDDQTLVLEIAKTLDARASPVRLAPIATDGTLQSLNLLGDGKADLAVARGDSEMPADTTSVAILRKNVVVLWTPSGQRGGRARISEIKELAGRRFGVAGLGDANVALLRVILAESGVNPQKVSIVQFGMDRIADMTQDTSLDAFMMVGALDGKVIADAVAVTARRRGEPKFLGIDVADAIAERHPLYESEEIPASAFAASPARPGEKTDTVGINHLIVAPGALSEDTVAA